MKKFTIFILLLYSFTAFAQFEPYIPNKKEEKKSEIQRYLKDSVYFSQIDEAECLIKAGRSLNMALLMPVIGSGVLFVASNTGMGIDEMQPYYYVSAGLGLLGIIFYLRGSCLITMAGQSMKYKQLKKTSLAITQTENGTALVLRF